MPDLPQLLLFIAAGWLLNLTPGPDVLYIVSNALRSGVRAGMVAALGIVSGCFVHVFAAALGVVRCWPPRPPPSPCSSGWARPTWCGWA
jgi:threonine/homoserine/homoserine lactone efflux protein